MSSFLAGIQRLMFIPQMSSSISENRSCEKGIQSSAVHSEPAFTVRSPFDYRHTAIERWHDGCLVALDASTVKNGAGRI